MLDFLLNTCYEMVKTANLFMLILLMIGFFTPSIYTATVHVLSLKKTIRGYFWFAATPFSPTFNRYIFVTTMVDF